jgi:hypothetical protein
LVGVNVTLSVCCPTPGTVPLAGEYAKVPATVEVAFSCVALSAVPYGMAAGVAQVIVGVALFTVSVTLAVAFDEV